MGKKVLVVDDEIDITLLIKEGLELKGFQIESYNDPQVALHEFKPGFYDLALLDIRMPEINGFELYDQLKSRDPNIKTLFISALSYLTYDNHKDKQPYPIKGERHFIKKPVGNKELL